MIHQVLVTKFHILELNRVREIRQDRRHVVKLEKEMKRERERVNNL